MSSPTGRSPNQVAEALRQLETFRAAGYEPFPLAPRSKRPAHKGWQGIDCRKFDWRKWLRTGGNAGLRLGARDVVVDFDPRNAAPGDDPVARLSEAVGIDLRRAPRVRTGSGGEHLFWKLPEGVRLKAKLDDYQGVDFKRIGGFVVAAGSVHPETGKPYRLDPTGPDPAKVSRAPEALVELVRRPDRPERVEASGVLEPEDLERLLGALDPADYGQGQYDRWIRLAAACHDAVGGGTDGLLAFSSWCARDDAYDFPEAVEAVERHWESFEAGRPHGVTAATLYWEVAQAGHGELVRELVGEAARDKAVEALAGEPLPEVSEPTEPDDDDDWVDVADVDPADIPLTPWLLKGLLLHRAITLLAGKGGSGKSLLAWQIAIAVALGIAFACWEKPEHRRRVLVLSGEDDVDEIRKRVAVACEVMGVNRDDLVSWFHVYRAGGIRLVERDSAGKVRPTKLWKKTRRRLERDDVGLLVVDPAIKASAGFDESSNSDQEEAQKAIRALTKGLDCAVLLNDHARKGEGGGRDSTRGASSKVDDARVACELRPLTDGEYNRLKTRTPQASLVLFRTVKTNYGAPSGNQYFEFCVRDVGNGEERVAFAHRTESQLQTFLNAATCPFRDELLAMVAEGRADGEPWSASKQGRKEARLVLAVEERFGLDAEEAGQWLEAFEDEGLIEKEERWSKSRNKVSIWRVAGPSAWSAEHATDGE